MKRLSLTILSTAVDTRAAARLLALRSHLDEQYGQRWAERTGDWNADRELANAASQLTHDPFTWRGTSFSPNP